MPRSSRYGPSSQDSMSWPDDGSWADNSDGEEIFLRPDDINRLLHQPGVRLLADAADHDDPLWILTYAPEYELGYNEWEVAYNEPRPGEPERWVTRRVVRWWGCYTDRNPEYTAWFLERRRTLQQRQGDAAAAAGPTPEEINSYIEALDASSEDSDAGGTVQPHPEFVAFVESHLVTMASSSDAIDYRDHSVEIAAQVATDLRDVLRGERKRGRGTSLAPGRIARTRNNRRDRLQERSLRQAPQ
jgi:hypothetical protein